MRWSWQLDTWRTWLILIEVDFLNLEEFQTFQTVKTNLHWIEIEFYSESTRKKTWTRQKKKLESDSDFCLSTGFITCWQCRQRLLFVDRLSCLFFSISYCRQAFCAQSRGLSIAACFSELVLLQVLSSLILLNLLDHHLLHENKAKLSIISTLTCFSSL